MDQATFFRDTSDDLRALFDAGFSRLKLGAGETLFEQDDFDDKLYVLDEGLLEVSVYSVSGRKLSLNQLRPQSVFGEIAIFDPGPRTARIEALQPSALRSIRQATLMDAVVKRPHLAKDFLALAGRRMRWMSRQMEEQVFLTPTARLAAKVLYLADEDLQIQMSQAKLADYVGVTREAVSKTLSDWKREGLVTVSRGKIKVLQPDALLDIKAADLI